MKDGEISPGSFAHTPEHGFSTRSNPVPDSKIIGAFAPYDVVSTTVSHSNLPVGNQAILM